MSVNSEQVCDGCGQKRPIKFGYHGQPRDRDDARRRGGWLIVKVFEDLCPDCINAALTNRTATEQSAALAGTDEAGQS